MAHRVFVSMQGRLGSMPGTMATIVALLKGAAGEEPKTVAMELLHRLVARNSSNRSAYVGEKGAIACLVSTLKSTRDASAICDAAWVVGILSTSGSREELLHAGVQKCLQGIQMRSSLPSDLKAAVEFALRSL